MVQYLLNGRSMILRPIALTMRSTSGLTALREKRIELAQVEAGDETTVVQELHDQMHLSLAQRQQAGIAAGGGGVDRERALEREAVQIERAARLGACP
jgi:hypothetical protein